MVGMCIWPSPNPYFWTLLGQLTLRDSIKVAQKIAMNQMTRTLVLLALVSISSSCGGGGGGFSGFQVPGTIVSDVFKECLQAQAALKGWRGNGDVRSIECQRKEDVSDYGQGVETLEGVQVFSNLEEIIMYGSGNPALGQVPDLSPLSGLTRLRVVEMYDSAVQSLGPLRGKTQLERLVFIPTSFSDLSPLQTLPNLKHINFSTYNRALPLISDFSPLSSIASLEELHLAVQNELPLAGLGFLNGMSGLKLLDISGNWMTDLNGIQFVPGLEVLDISYNHFMTMNEAESAALLSGLTNLKEFYCVEFGGQSLGFIQNMSELEILSLTRKWQIDAAEMTYIGSLTSLRELYLRDITVKLDIFPLQGLSNLRKLWIASLDIDGATLVLPQTLASLEEIHLLDAFDSQYDFGDQRGDFKASYSVFQDLPRLAELNMIRPWLADPVGVTLNPNIDALTMIGARLENVDFLTDVPGIRRLDLSQNLFTELDPLTTMPDLAELTLNDTIVGCAEIDEFKAAAPGVSVTTNLNCS